MRSYFLIGGATILFVSLIFIAENELSKPSAAGVDAMPVAALSSPQSTSFVATSSEFELSLNGMTFTEKCQVDSSFWLCPLSNEVDQDTLQIMLGPDGLPSMFAKDKNHVYSMYTEGPAIFSEADPASFEVLSVYPWRWTKDQSHVWFDLSLVAGADPSSFVLLSNGQYAKDCCQVYWNGGVVDGGGNPASIKLYPYTDYAGDDAHVYFLGSIVPEANPSAFIDLGDGYGKDQQHVWFDGNLVPAPDPASFKALNENGVRPDAKDKYHTYWQGSVIY
jgi:DKNYY family